MIRSAVTLKIPREIDVTLKKEAKRRHPKEAFAYLLGIDNGDVIAVEDIWIPDDLDKYSTKTKVYIQDRWHAIAAVDAKEEDLEVVGDWHSHPYTGSISLDAGLSGTDMKYGWNGVCGLCVVVKHPSGRVVSRNVFYGPLAYCDKRLVA